MLGRAWNLCKFLFTDVQPILFSFFLCVINEENVNIFLVVFAWFPQLKAARWKDVELKISK